MRDWILLLFFSAVALTPPAAADAKGPRAFTGKVVVHAENGVRALKRTELAAIFLGKKSTWDSGKRIIPILQSERSPVAREFLREILGRSLSQYRAHWKRRLFSGGGTVPRTLPTAEEVMAFVARHPGAIGVVAGSSQPDGRMRTIGIRD